MFFIRYFRTIRARRQARLVEARQREIAYILENAEKAIEQLREAARRAWLAYHENSRTEDSLPPEIVVPVGCRRMRITRANLPGVCK